MRDTPFTFSVLDGLAFAAGRGRLNHVAPSTKYAISQLGPLMELRQLGAGGVLPQPHHATWLDLGAAASFDSALRAGRRQWIGGENPTAGFFRTGPTWSEDDTAWVGFGLAVQKAAVASRFHRRIAAQFVAALVELVSNVHEHSDASASGIAAFTARSLIDLMEEDRIFRFSDVDMPARLLFARYINFNRDKVQHPEILCWPGAWFAGDRASAQSLAIFDRNRALFIDKENDDSIFPAVLPGKDDKIVHETFNRFYAWVVNYDLTSQWIAGDGPFDYSYEWLSKTNHPKEVREWAARGFEHSYGVHPDKFVFL